MEIPGAEGYFGVLPGHTPLLASLAVGEMWYGKGTEKTYLSIAYGFAEVLPDRRDDPGAARRARRGDRRPSAPRRRARAPRSGSPRPKSDVDYERARIALAKSLSRLQVSSRIGISPRTGALKRVRTQG